MQIITPHLRRSIAFLPAAYRASRKMAPGLLGLVFTALAIFSNAVTADPVDAQAMQQVVVPVQLDYPLLKQLLIAQMFTGTGNSREVLDDPSGCSEVLLSAPALAAGESQLELLADLRARIGMGSVGSCTTMLSWQGKIGIGGRPEIRNEGTALGFVPDRVWLLDPQGKPINNGSLQMLAEAGVRSAFGRFLVDLSPQLMSVGEFLPEVLPQHSRQQIEALLATLRVSSLQVTDASLDADIAFSVEALPEPLAPERALTDVELARWEERWQLMDSLLVLVVKHYSATTQLQELRDALLDALIESRYRLRDALVEIPDTTTDTTTDAVREWFLQSWQALTPIIRRIGIGQPGQEHLLLLSVIAATDALDALDQLGPNVGLDISTDGLRRLARMIISGSGDDLLQYSGEVDPELRGLLDESLRTNPPPTSWRLDFSLFPKAMAADMGRLNSWAPKRKDLAEYLPLVGALLNSSAKEAISSRNLDPSYKTMFRQLVLTTAWQESCWRHYVVSDDRKLVPLRSGTGDVGLMQINERVWRGFYDQQKLRWDIDYNGAAGAEVLIDYLLRYAIRKGEHRQPGGFSNLARASYSAYNGGPSKVARYRSDKASAYGKKVDAAFWDKYQQVVAGDELAVSRCLGGNLSGPVVAANPADRKGALAQGNQRARSASSSFTLQLGAFSTGQSARLFIEQNALGAMATVRKRDKNAAGQYLVLYGDYVARTDAEAVRQKLVRLEPWIRQFADVQ
ncbi:MAG: transglycosylase SLT domain-containing protein [Congregibacter sp.]